MLHDAKRARRAARAVPYLAVTMGLMQLGTVLLGQMTALLVLSTSLSSLLSRQNTYYR